MEYETMRDSVKSTNLIESIIHSEKVNSMYVVKEHLTILKNQLAQRRDITRLISWAVPFFGLTLLPLVLIVLFHRNINQLEPLMTNSFVAGFLWLVGGTLLENLCYGTHMVSYFSSQLVKNVMLTEIQYHKKLRLSVEMLNNRSTQSQLIQELNKRAEKLSTIEKVKYESSLLNFSNHLKNQQFVRAFYQLIEIDMLINNSMANNSVKNELPVLPMNTYGIKTKLNSHSSGLRDIKNLL